MGHDKPPGEIRSDSLYRLDELKARLGISRVAWRKLEGQGLPVVKFGTRKYVHGAACVKFFEQIEPSQN